MVLVVCLNPTLQKTLHFAKFIEGEVNRSKTYYLDASGKGVNVSRVLQQLEVPCLHLTHAGGQFRDLFLKKAAEDGVEIVAPDSHSEVRFCTTVLNQERKTTTELVEEPYPVRPETDSEIRQHFTHLLSTCETVIISGTRSPGYTASLYADMVKEAKEQGKWVILDIRGQDLLSTLLPRPHVLKINLKEFVETFLNLKDIQENMQDPSLLPKVEEQFSNIWEQWGVYPLVTNGKEDTLYYKEGKLHRLAVPKPLDPASILNTIGCGDAFTAGFVKAWREAAYPPPQSLAFSQQIERFISFAQQVALLNAYQIRPGRIQ
ncbi:MAG: PfkB family carbohydrate kinase [Spirochaetales bacterium]